MLAAGCAVATPVTRNRGANIANPAPAIAFITMPHDPSSTMQIWDRLARLFRHDDVIESIKE
jgi:hypothetical protein